MIHLTKQHLFGLLACAGMLTACSDSNDQPSDNIGGLTPSESSFGKATGNFTASEWYPGGELGTTTNASYSAPAPAVEQLGMDTDFKIGEDFFEHLYTYDVAPRKGLGPAWVRNGCIYCHPSYGHGQRQTEYRANKVGNGYLLVIYHPNEAFTSDGVRYTTAPSSYISEVTGMPQTQAMSPFKAPIDESQIKIQWNDVKTLPSGLAEYDAGKNGFTFPDGEVFSLIYPDVTIPATAFNTNPLPTNYEVRLESTIGIYGTGLLDAITQEDMKEQYAKEAQHVTLNPAMWDAEANDWAASAWYTLADGTKGIKKFTYAMTRTSLQDGAGANAIWNITNVTRSDRHYLYTTDAWAKAQSEDPAVISYIKEHGASASSILHPYYADGTDAGIKERVNKLLSLNCAGSHDKAQDRSDFKLYFVDGAPYNGEEEMTDKQYYQFMVWHRGLAVPAARNLTDQQVQHGKALFTQLGCASCHRPSWTTGSDNLWIDASIKAYAQSIGKNAADIMPRFPNQTIWPYTDLVQHRLFMENDIRTGWCRTTPLWGRGLSRQLTGADDRLHDCRARTVIEAIMWHGYSKQSDAFQATKAFYNLPKADRDAVVKFIESI